MLIRCTQKLRTEMGLKLADLQSAGGESLLGDWYAHLSFQDRKKCVLFVAEKTLLCFLATCLSRDRIRQLDEVFRDGLFRLLLDEGFQPGQATRLFDECETVRYGAAADRSMTGSMNELVKIAAWWLPEHGGAERSDLRPLNHALNDVPMKRNGYTKSIELTRWLLED